MKESMKKKLENLFFSHIVTFEIELESLKDFFTGHFNTIFSPCGNESFPLYLFSKFKKNCHTLYYIQWNNIPKLSDNTKPIGCIQWIVKPCN